jgi:broad specificity phosphatase PhoE
VGDVVEEWPDMTAGLAAGRFDFDHVGPEIAEELAAELTRFIRELQDSEARQRARQILVIVHRSISSM